MMLTFFPLPELIMSLVYSFIRPYLSVSCLSVSSMFLCDSNITYLSNNFHLVETKVILGSCICADTIRLETKASSTGLYGIVDFSISTYYERDKVPRQGHGFSAVK
jgi:hypothetical protein